MKLRSPREVLIYWYGEEYITNKQLLSSIAFLNSRLYKWFSGKDSSFLRIQHENIDLIDKVANDYPITPSLSDDISSNIDDWQSIEGLHAKVILFDQFPREVYRRTSKAFAYDIYALQILSYFIEKNLLTSNQFLYAEKFLLLHVYLHSENKEHHVKLVELCKSVVENESSEIITHQLRTIIPFFGEHSKVIFKFGRYPSRNYALNRISTLEEEEWLSSPDLPSWAKSQMNLK